MKYKPIYGTTLYFIFKIYHSFKAYINRIALRFYEIAHFANCCKDFNYKSLPNFISDP